MASDRQIQANRANAQRSTGPRSKAGRDRSRLNSRKHGLTAKTLVTVGEYADDFEELRAELLEQYAPQSAMEAELVERLAVTLWRLRRVPFFEAAILDARYHQVYEIKEAEAAQKYSRSAWMAERSESEEEENRLESDEDDNEEDEEAADREKSVHFGLALIRDGFHDDALGKLSRHETSLMNALTKTLQLLLLVQENRDNSNVIEVTPVVALPKAA